MKRFWIPGRYQLGIHRVPMTRNSMMQWHSSTAFLNGNRKEINTKSKRMLWIIQNTTDAGMVTSRSMP
jgi:hypothetical protein